MQDAVCKVLAVESPRGVSFKESLYFYVLSQNIKNSNSIRRVLLKRRKDFLDSFV